MKRIFFYASTILIVLIVSVSCKKEEILEPSEITSMSRFEFPEGNNSYDAIFNELYKKYDTRIIYKAWQPKDWEKTWTQGATSTQYVVLGEHYLGADTLQAVAEFYKRTLSYLDTTAARKLLPQYIYVIKNWRYDWGKIGISYLAKKLDGLDFWLFSFPASDYLGTDTEKNMRGARCTIINSYVELAVKNGIFVEPQGFKDDVDYNTPVKNKPEYINDPNYYLTRGFVDIVNTAKFTSTSPLGELANPAYNLGVSTIGSDFLAYLRISMYYSEAEINQHYAGYTLLLKRYNLVKNYMKSKYNFDLNAIATGH